MLIIKKFHPLHPSSKLGGHYIMNAKLIHVVNYMPKKIINNIEFFEKVKREHPESNDPLKDSSFFKGVEERRFASPEYTSGDLGALVLKKLLKETGTPPEKLDFIIFSCMFNDTFWPSIASSVQYKAKAKNAAFVNIDTSCCSFISGLNIAESMIKSGRYKTIAIVTVTNFISRLKEFQLSLRSAVLGDGATAALMHSDKKNSVIAIKEQSFGENYGLMRFEPDLVNDVFYNYWERGCGPITVNFTKESIELIRNNAIEIVPKMAKICLKQANLKTENINLLITHQPNVFFIDTWRNKIGIPKERTFNTLKKYGNLFQGSIPVTIADALEQKIIKPGDKVLLSTFSNGGDFGAAAILQF
jgi:3-oxoacyl-(acyl-carrier-protein) synthase III